MFWNKPKKKPARAGGRIFLDYASVTPVDEEVSLRMKKCQDEVFGNPSALYEEGIKAKEEVKKSREIISKILNVRPSEIIFTSGGTEGNNLALLGVFDACKTESPPAPDQAGGRAGFIPHVITTTIEHPAILEVCKEIEKRGGEVTYVGVGEDGIVNPKDISNALKKNTILVSVMYANNEIGTVQPIAKIGKILKEWRERHDTVSPYFHVDACQAPLYLPMDIAKYGVNLITLDGIKIYGPRGIGILYIDSDVHINSIMFGGGQEKGLRSGTENVSSIVGVAKALEIAQQMKEKESERLVLIRDYTIEQILKNFPKATLNGSEEYRLPNNINICFPGLDAEFAVISLDVSGISASYSSSCRTLSENSSSYVVTALGKDNCSLSSLRFTLGRETTKGDIDELLLALKKVCK